MTCIDHPNFLEVEELFLHIHNQIEPKLVIFELFQFFEPSSQRLGCSFDFGLHFERVLNQISI